MASASVSGLVSGLDTATIISQLMQVEAQPQTMLKTRLSTEQSTVSTLQALNARFATLASKAHDLTTTASWSPLTATSSSTQVSATAATTAVPGGLSFTVNSTAAAHRLSFGTTAKGSDVVVSPNVTLTRRTARPSRSTPAPAPWTTWSPGSTPTGTPASPPARSGSTTAVPRLAWSPTRPGRPTASRSATAVRPPRQRRDDDRRHRTRQIQVGADKIHSSSNTFTGLSRAWTSASRPARPAGTAVTVTVARNAAGGAGVVAEPGRRANDILSAIDSITNVDPADKSAGPLAGDSMVRDLRSKVLGRGHPRRRTAPRWPAIGSRPTAAARSPSTLEVHHGVHGGPGGVAAKLGHPRRPPCRASRPGWRRSASRASDSTTGALTQTHHGPAVLRHHHAGQHRRLGHPAGHAQGRPDPPVLRA